VHRRATSLHDKEIRMPDTIRRGSNGTSVRDAQRKLKALGFDVGLVDGNFGSRMEGAVKSFQRTHNFSDCDGVVGNVTWSKINSAAANLG